MGFYLVVLSLGSSAFRMISIGFDLMPLYIFYSQLKKLCPVLTAEYAMNLFSCLMPDTFLVLSSNVLSIPSSTILHRSSLRSESQILPFARLYKEPYCCCSVVVGTRRSMGPAIDHHKWKPGYKGRTWDIAIPLFMALLHEY